MTTIYTRFSETARKYSDKTAVLWKENQSWQKADYRKFMNGVDCLAESLADLGVVQGNNVAILSENRPEWLMSDLALNKLGAVSVPIHITGNQHFIEHVLRDSGSKYLIASQAMLEKNPYLKDNDQLRSIVLVGNGDKAGNVVIFEDLFKEKREKFRDPAGDENNLASIIYTSGTTGEPKGVMLSNKNFISDIDASVDRIKVYPEDLFLSFLPVSHVLERTGGSLAPILNGCSIAYAEGIKKLSDNLVEIKPTVLVCVPKIFENVHEKILAKMHKAPGPIKRFFFCSLKKEPNSFFKKIADLIIYRKIRRSLGGNLRFAISGGASIHDRILRFFKNINVTIYEGYGMTETSPIIAANGAGYNKIGTVGQPIKNLQIKISVDKELLVKGDSVMLGYWRNEEKTKETFTEDGWLKTGDLGFLDSENYLTIIGRKKEIIVTSNGKNISPEKVEGVINLSPYILQSLVVGHGRSSLAALLVPDKELIAGRYGEEKVDLKKLMEKELKTINNQLMPHERIRNFHILEAPFSIEADELTPTLKVRRKIIEAKNIKIIEKICQ